MITGTDDHDRPECMIRIELDCDDHDPPESVITIDRNAQTEGHAVKLEPIRYHPDEAGLVGCVQLAPSWIFSGHDSILAVDIGGTNIRAGLIGLNLKKAKDLSAARVRASV